MSKVLAALSTILFVAIHAIHYNDDAGKRKVAKPGEAFYPPEADVAFLKRQGSVREANEQEIAFYEKQNGGKPKAAAKPKTTKGGGSESGSGADTSGGGASNDTLV